MSIPTRDFNPDFSGATCDDHLVTLWLANRPKSTTRLYRREARKFREHLGETGLREATVADVVAYVKALTGAPTTQSKMVRIVKSLLSYAHKTGYTVFNVGKVIRCPKTPDRLHERILDEQGVATITKTASKKGRYTTRNHTLVRFFYASGARISEVSRLSFKDVRGNRVTFHGKGEKTRTVLIPEAVADELRALRLPEDTDESAVFKSFRGVRLLPRSLRWIIAQITREAGHGKVSPHWFRHAHASHALDNGAPVHLVQQSLGHQNVATTSRYLHIKPNAGASQYLTL